MSGCHHRGNIYILYGTKVCDVPDHICMNFGNAYIMLSEFGEITYTNMSTYKYNANISLTICIVNFKFTVLLKWDSIFVLLLL